MPHESKTLGVSTGTQLLRNEPVQARSTARLAALLDAAAAVISEIGYERLTTALVAEHAGASIGTVYRYFPDRIVVLQGLSAKFLRDSLDAVESTLIDPSVTTWSAAVESVIDGIVASFRTVPGFSSLRFGDVLDLGDESAAVSGSSAVASALASGLASRFEFVAGAELDRAALVAIDVLDAVLARAFRLNPKGDAALIAQAKSLAIDVVSTVKPA